MRDPFSERPLSEEEWKFAVERTFEVRVELPDWARAMSMLPNFNSFILVRPGVTGRPDDSGRWATGIIARSEVFLLSHPPPRAPPEWGDLVRAAFEKGDVRALEEVQRLDPSTATAFGLARRSFDLKSRAPEVKTTDPPGFWEALPKQVRTSLIDRYREGNPRAPVDSSEVATLVLDQLRAATAGHRRGFVPPRSKEEPVSDWVGKSTLARALGSDASTIQRALRDLTSFWAMHRWLEIEYVQDATRVQHDSALAPDGGQLALGVDDAVVGTAIERRRQRFNDEESSKLWSERVDRATRLYLELVKSSTDTNAFGKCAEEFLRDPVLWAWLRARYLRDRPLEPSMLQI